MIDGIIKKLIYLTILATPLFTINEFIMMLSGTIWVVSAAEATDYRIKIIKDIALLVIIGLTAIYLFMRKKIAIPNIILLLIVVINGLIIGILMNGMNFTVVALRIYLPLLLAFVSINLFKEKDYESLNRIVIWLAVFEIIVCFCELLFFGGAVQKRVIGTFPYPNALAFFMLLVISILLSKNRNIYENMILLLSFLTVIVTKSGIGVILIGGQLVIYLLIVNKRINAWLKPLIFIPVVVIMIIVVISLPALLNRQSLYSRSASARVGVFVEYFKGGNVIDILFGRGLGVGTNTTKYLASTGTLDVSENTFVADSLFTSLLAQIGIFGLLIFIILNLYLIYLSFKYKFTFGILFFPIYLLYNVSGIAFEVFPINWIYPIMIGRVFQLRIYNKIRCHT